MPVVVTIKSYLATLQETRNINLSVRQLARDTGIKQSALSKIANNHIDGISRKKLAAIISVLREYDDKVDIRDLLKFVD